MPVRKIYVRTPIDGLENPDRRMGSFLKPGGHGGIVSSQLYGFRNISFEGEITGNDFAEYEANRQALIAATAIKIDSIGNPVPIRVSFTTMAGASYFVDLYFNRPIMKMVTPISSQFQISGVAADAFIYGSTQVTSTNISPPTGGGYIVPMIAPYVSDPSSGGSVTVNNPGQESALPNIYLTGQLTNPTIMNQTTGKTLALTYTLASGDTAIINMADHLITLNNSSSIIGTKTPESDWWSVATGNNTILVSTTGGSDTGYVTLGFYPPSIGVA
jgi:hypothetical protein